MPRTISEYDFFWIGKRKATKEATEEWIHVLKTKYVTQETIAKKHDVSPSAINSNIKNLIKKGLVELPVHDFSSDGVCVVCKKNPATQKHHLNYNPEVIIYVCLFCHGLIHSKNSIGKEKNIKTKNEPFLSALPFYIKTSDGNALTSRQNNRDGAKYYMNLLRTWRKTRNPDEIRILAENIGLTVTDKEF